MAVGGTLSTLPVAADREYVMSTKFDAPTGHTAEGGGGVAANVTTGLEAMPTVAERVTWLEQPAGPAVAVNSTLKVPTVHVLPLRWQR